MSRSGFRLTFGQGLAVTVIGALALVSLRLPGGPMVVIITGFAIHGFIRDRIKGGAGFGGGMIAGGLAAVGYEVAHYIYAYTVADPLAFPQNFLVLLPVMLIGGVLWGAAVGVVLQWIFKRPDAVPPAGDGCGPIAWRGFADGPNPPPSASRGDRGGGARA